MEKLECIGYMLMINFGKSYNPLVFGTVLPQDLENKDLVTAIIPKVFKIIICKFNKLKLIYFYVLKIY